MMKTQNMDYKELKSWRLKHKFKQPTLAKIIGQASIAISKIERGIRNITPAEEKLLENFIRDVDAKESSKNSLELHFTQDEWNKIVRLAVEDNTPNPIDWIVKKIRNYISMHD